MTSCLVRASDADEIMRRSHRHPSARSVLCNPCARLPSSEAVYSFVLAGLGVVPTQGSVAGEVDSRYAHLAAELRSELRALSRCRRTLKCGQHSALASSAEATTQQRYKLRASLRREARLQQVKLSDKLAGRLVGELAGAGNTVDFGPFGTKPDQAQPPLDLVDLVRQ